MSRDSNSAAELKYGIKICCELGNFYRNSRPVLLLECKTLFVILSHKFGNNVHAGLFVSGFFDSGPRIEEPDFYSWWQEEKVWAPASADQVG